MNRSKETSSAMGGARQNQSEQGANQSADSIEIELDTQQLLALNAADVASSIDDALNEHTLTETAANLERDQSLDDLRNLSWPGVTPALSRHKDE